jgi:dTDP-4-amino-4,6-dideoxygalactose transaminase
MLSHDDGEAVARLEAEVSRRFEVASAVCVPMARTGLYLALREILQPGQTVILSPLTLVDVVNMVLLAGGIPVFADIVRRSCALDPEQAESLIDRRTGAVLATHLHGESAGAHLLREICRRRGVPLIEDAAQAFGAVEQGRRLGGIGDVGVYSFGVYKNLSAWRGGMIVSHDAGLIARVRKRMDAWPRLSRRSLLSWCAKGLLADAATWPPLFAAVTYPIIRYGVLHGFRAVTRRLDPEDGARRLDSMPQDYFGGMSDAQALLALRQLERVDADSALRNAHAARYHEALAGLEGLVTPRRHDGLSHIYTYYPIQYRERDALLRHALARGRDLAAQHLRNCADLPEFKEFRRECPNARAASRELILLPTYPRYPEAEIERNIDAIRDFIGRTD